MSLLHTFYRRQCRNKRATFVTVGKKDLSPSPTLFRFIVHHLDICCGVVNVGFGLFVDFNQSELEFF